MEKRDYYDVLGVSRDSADDQIKKAYRQLALKYHPDRNPGDKDCEEHFKEATEAYSVLSDAEKRQRYDRFGHAAFANGADGFSDFSGFAEDIFGDIFGAFFGTNPFGSQGSRAKSGRDLKYNLTITLEEAAFGCEKEITIQKPVNCETCDGTGARKGSTPERCRQCGGAGQIRIQQGFFAISRPCNVCRGAGQVNTDPCAGCGGTGKKTKEQRLSVKVPAGINNGQRLKLRGEGEEAPKGGVAGDLYVEIGLKSHKVFKRKDNDIVCELAIGYSQAVLGGDVEVPTLAGTTTLKVPPGTQSGKIFRLRGKGIVDLQTGKLGDQHVVAYVHIPSPKNDRHRQLLEELATVEGKPKAGSSHESRSFFEKVREFFD